MHTVIRLDVHDASVEIIKTKILIEKIVKQNQYIVNSVNAVVSQHYLKFESSYNKKHAHQEVSERSLRTNRSTVTANPHTCAAR